MIRPPYLNAGDKVVIIAPARKVPSADIASAVSILSSWGLKVHFGKNFDSQFHSYLGGSDQERISDFQDAISDPSVRAIISARGGYGSSRIVDQLDFSPLRKSPKWFIGFSDVTAVHLRLWKEGTMSVHGTMPLLFTKPNAELSVKSLQQLLFTGEFSLHAEKISKNIAGTSSGRIVGGNLSIIADALGTSTDPDMNDAILFIEEIDEFMYRLDRMMTHLKRAGKLKQIKGLAVGYMTDLKDPETFKDSYEQIILSAVKEYSYPVAFGFPSGHENPNLAWMEGAMVNLTVNDGGSSIVPVQTV